MDLLDDIRAHRGSPGVRVWWLGQSGFLVHWNGRYLLLDPYLSDSLTKKYENTDKPHVRMKPLVVDPARLGMIDVVTSSHNHTDHLDAETLNPLRAANPGLQMVIPEANRAFVATRLGSDPNWPVGLNDGESKQIGPFKFHAIASAHEELDRTPEGLFPYLGYVVEIGGFMLYHPGDCVLYSGLPEKLKCFSIDLAMLPINGSLRQRHVAGNFWGREAAQLAKDGGIRLVIPCHYDMFEFNTVTPDEFIEHCERLGQPYRILTGGGVLQIGA